MILDTNREIKPTIKSSKSHCYIVPFYFMPKTKVLSIGAFEFDVRGHIRMKKIQPRYVKVIELKPLVANEARHIGER